VIVVVPPDQAPRRSSLHFRGVRNPVAKRER